jgi:uncharacterized protein (DUF1778 family)
MEPPIQTVLRLRVPAALLEAMQKAAAQLGRPVDEFTVSVLAESTREVIEGRSETVLSDRDWQRLLGLLDDVALEPSPALKAAAARHKRSVA